ncbi:hypothetical protein [Sinomonas gamaensis]|uniref:hypothetical protein n=1 Tax=Sinomonas gamaensis TaxID=2565624 RepID=UPI001107AF2D|nr:hypothetical protein [Sinomonas gamaensis]
MPNSLETIRTAMALISRMWVRMVERERPHRLCDLGDVHDEGRGAVAVGAAEPEVGDLSELGVGLPRPGRR